MGIRVAATVAAVLTVASCTSGQATTSDLDKLTIAAEGPADGYDRDEWGDYDRDAVLRNGHRSVPDCNAYWSPADAACHNDPSAVHVDHIVPLAEAYVSGGNEWDTSTREEYAADSANLWLMTAGLNMSKSDQEPGEWMPEHDRCHYVQTWIRVKHRYDLAVDPDERAELARIIRADC